jgi:hypothetical protein
MANSLGYGLTNADITGKKGIEAKTNIQEDYTKADVYYQTLNVKSIVQTEIYNVSKLRIRKVFLQF